MLLEFKGDLSLRTEGDLTLTMIFYGKQVCEFFVFPKKKGNYKTQERIKQNKLKGIMIQIQNKLR